MCHCSLFATARMNLSGIQRPLNRSRHLSRSSPWFSRMLMKASTSAWSGARSTAIEPGRFPACLTSRLDSLNTRSIGIRPSVLQPVLLMIEPVERRLCTWRPIPPACFEISAHSVSVE